MPRYWRGYTYGNALSLRYAKCRGWLWTFRKYTDYPDHLDLRFTKTGQLRIPATKDQEKCGCCWAIASTTVFSTAVFDARIGQKDRLLDFSEQYLVDCISEKKKHLSGCRGVPIADSFELIQTDGLPLNSFYEYKSGVTGKPQSCGVASKKALTQTMKKGLLYKASEHGTLQGYKAAMDFLTAKRLPLVTRIFAPPSIHEYDGTFVYAPSIKECEEA
ncbi:hypothetical protein niasHT_027803 [Heterodera trifolii]|uniref:Peptidase C1A papain C-terminal domain-containing protein n=1 Tax=Heterodera trifolii TaxID=157864 RepID=A0ABD2JFN7_9BILA